MPAGSKRAFTAPASRHASVASPWTSRATFAHSGAASRTTWRRSGARGRSHRQPGALDTDAIRDAVERDAGEDEPAPRIDEQGCVGARQRSQHPIESRGEYRQPESQSGRCEVLALQTAHAFDHAARRVAGAEISAEPRSVARDGGFVAGHLDDQQPAAPGRAIRLRRRNRSSVDERAGARTRETCGRDGAGQRVAARVERGGERRARTRVAAAAAATQR